MYRNMKKEDFRTLAVELGATVPAEATISVLKDLIERTNLFKTEKEFVSNLAETILNERLKNEKKADELAALQRTEHSSSPPLSLESFITSVKLLSIPVPEKPELMHLFFNSVENAFEIKKVPDHLKSEILLCVLGEKANSLLVYMSEEEISDYETLKSFVLKESQPTPLECLHNFREAQQMQNETYSQFSTRVSSLFDCYLRLRNVSDFKALVELMIHDKLYESLNEGLKTHLAAKYERWLPPRELGKEVDLYFSLKGKPASNQNPLFYRPHNIPRGNNTPPHRYGYEARESFSQKPFGRQDSLPKYANPVPISPSPKVTGPRARAHLFHLRGKRSQLSLRKRLPKQTGGGK